MKRQEKTIVMLSILFGMFSIGMGNMAQYAETQEYFSIVGIIFMVWSFAFWITIKKEQNATK